VSECPALIALGPAPNASKLLAGDKNETLWVLLYSQNSGVEKTTSRYDLTLAIVGYFDGRRFEPLFEQEFDFGAHAFAFQANYFIFFAKKFF
jgi:beta-fructofuranosidase